ncbi:hypothetical protein ACTFIU_003755 [Dictyostelium citrinum]
MTAVQKFQASLNIDRLSNILKSFKARATSSIVGGSSYLYNAVKTSASNVKRTQRISNRLLGRLINGRLYQRRMSIQLRQDDETVSQPQFQVKSRKECPRTNSKEIIGLQYFRNYQIFTNDPLIVESIYCII